LAGSIFFIGHVSVDKVKNINGIKVQPGGAALYAAIAAKTLFDDVRLASVVGKDYPFIEVLNSFPRRYLRTYRGRSTKFTISYDDRWDAHYLEAYYGPSSKISSSLMPMDKIQPNTIVHVSPLPPAKVEKIVSAIRKASDETKVSINTWIGYIKGKKNKEILRKLASEADFFIMSDSEAKNLTETAALSTALRLLKAKMLVVTLGELGAIINREDGGTQVVPALRFPVEKVVDTTGAGDTWCGSFLAAYKVTGDLVKSVTSASVISSIKCTGWGFSKLLNLRFKSIDSITDYVIGLKEGSLQKKISDYYP